MISDWRFQSLSLTKTRVIKFDFWVKQTQSWTGIISWLHVCVCVCVCYILHQKTKYEKKKTCKSRRWRMESQKGHGWTKKKKKSSYADTLRDSMTSYIFFPPQLCPFQGSVEKNHFSAWAAGELVQATATSTVIICMQVEGKVKPVIIRSMFIFIHSLNFHCYGDSVLHKYTTSTSQSVHYHWLFWVSAQYSITVRFTLHDFKS